MIQPGSIRKRIVEANRYNPLTRWEREYETVGRMGIIRVIAKPGDLELGRGKTNAQPTRRDRS